MMLWLFQAGSEKKQVVFNLDKNSSQGEFITEDCKVTKHSIQGAFLIGMVRGQNILRQVVL